MIDQLLLALPMMSIIIGAFVLMLLSHSRHFNLKGLNFVAVSFLLFSLLVQFVQHQAHCLLYWSVLVQHS